MKSITADELKEKLASGEDMVLIDVREDFEHEEYNIGGMLVPLGEILNRATEIPADKTVILYCRKGVRSQIAIQRLEQKFGYRNLVNLAGGMEDWKKMNSK